MTTPRPTKPKPNNPPPVTPPPTPEAVADAVAAAADTDTRPTFTINGTTYTATRGLDLVRGFGFRRAVRGMDDIDASIYLVEQLFNEDALAALDGYDIASPEFIDIMDQIFVGEGTTLGESSPSSG